MGVEVFRPGLFEGRVALVTGAGRGLSAAIASAFVALGARTLFHDIDSAVLADVVCLSPRDCLSGRCGSHRWSYGSE
jgi:NAD(P)-dependent dehydrogenase (short-subunit alcohol dehydrogenase family)